MIQALAEAPAMSQVRIAIGDVEYDVSDAATSTGTDLADSSEPFWVVSDKSNEEATC